MDPELLRYLEGMEGRLMAMEGRLVARMNDQHEQLLDRLTALEADFLNTKGFLIEDAIVSGRRNAQMEARLTRLERKQ